MCEKSSGPSPSLSASSTSRLRQVRARLHGQARKPRRGRGEDPSHHLVPSIKERIVNRFPIFLGGTDRAVELHQLAFELEEGGIVAGGSCFGIGLSSYRARLLYVRENTAARTRALGPSCASHLRSSNANSLCGRNSAGHRKS